MDPPGYPVFEPLNPKLKSRVCYFVFPNARRLIKVVVAISPGGGRGGLHQGFESRV